MFDIVLFSDSDTGGSINNAGFLPVYPNSGDRGTKIFFMFGVSFRGQSVFASYVIMPRSESFSQVAEYQIEQFFLKL